MCLLNLGNRGFATGLAMLILIIMSLLVGTYYYFVRFERKGFNEEMERERAYYLAESGYNLAVGRLMNASWEQRWYSGPDPGTHMVGLKKVLNTDIVHSTYFEKDFNGGKITVFVDEEPNVDPVIAETVLKCVHIYAKGIYRNQAKVIYGRIVMSPAPGYWKPYL